jgi:pimeloyl-ACP methyl ester carboxylesterase
VGEVTGIARPTGDIAIVSIELPEPGLQFQAGQVRESHHTGMHRSAHILDR